MIRDQPAQLRVRQREPAARRHAIGLVAEFLRPQLIEVLQHVRLEQLRVQRGHAIDRMAADAGEVCHAYLAVAVLPDQRQARKPVLIAQKTDPHLVQEMRVDLKYQLQVARQHLAEHIQRPLL